MYLKYILNIHSRSDHGVGGEEKRERNFILDEISIFLGWSGRDSGISQFYLSICLSVYQNFCLSSNKLISNLNAEHEILWEGAGGKVFYRKWVKSLKWASRGVQIKSGGG